MHVVTKKIWLSRQLLYLKTITISKEILPTATLFFSLIGRCDRMEWAEFRTFANVCAGPEITLD